MRRFLLAPVLACLPLLTYACGDDTEAAADDLEAACEAWCQEAFSLPCNDTGLSVDQCLSSCPYLETQLDGYCVGEYASALQCLADGGYECQNDFPTPLDLCIDQQTALQECQADAACQKFCDQSACGADCVDSCNADRDALGTCSYAYDFLLTCYADQGAGCAAGTPSPTGCEEEIMEVGDCVGSFNDDPCSGWCFAAERLGCGEGCAADCAEKIGDPTCGFQYESVIDCGLLYEAASCSGGELVPTDCSYELEQYDMCLSQP
ncbi:MAG: hypothetical protein IPM79_37935 [Polyangiaceae bacterium]|jgi:hypothetical protein|nr:hypothetical protein [Polyangiaceae bacterium]